MTTMTGIILPPQPSQPAFHRALLAQVAPPGQSAWRLQDHKEHILLPGQVRIKTTFVGLNPYDWQGVEFRFAIGEEPRVMGRDGAGVVVEVGSAVKRFKAGDRVGR
jgi:NADPH:quinone reductase-like Zn-dependent oxidoreductase